MNKNKKVTVMLNKDEVLSNNTSGRHGVRAFTLIELLVVVLIIGILSAIALPQYQKAVEKSKTTQALTLLKSVYQAALEYQMTNGEWPSSFNDLSIEIPWNGNTKWYSGVGAKDTRSNEDWSLQIFNYNNTQVGIYIGRISGDYKGGAFAILNKFTDSKIPLHQTICSERINEGIAFDTKKTPGAYCHGFFQGTELINQGIRFYSLP